MQEKESEIGKIGKIIEGKVTGITKYGAFVSTDGETAGMIHISELSSDFIKDINECLKMNQTIKAVVIGVNDNGKLALSIKRLHENTESLTNESSAGVKEKAGKKDARFENPEEFVKIAKTAETPRNFEDMMNKFKRDSDEKIAGLKFLEQKKSGLQRRSKKKK